MYKQVSGLLLAVAVSQGTWAQTGTPGPALATTTPRTVAAPSAANAVEAYVRAATVTKGSELDFDKILASKKQTGFLHNGSLYGKREYALVLWGLRVKALGIASAEQACALYASANKRTLTQAEKQALTDGFDSGATE